jgi:hypothetical protein
LALDLLICCRRKYDFTADRGPRFWQSPRQTGGHYRGTARVRAQEVRGGIPKLYLPMLKNRSVAFTGPDSQPCRLLKGAPKK